MSTTPQIRRSFMRRRSLAALAAVTFCAAAAISASSPAGAEAVAEPAPPGEYEIYDVRTLGQRNAIARTGVAIEDFEHGVATVTASVAGWCRRTHASVRP